MITEDTYTKILAAVEKEIPLPENWILESKTEDATDARHILCEYLRRHGLSSVQIQSATGLHKSTVNKLLSGVSDRLDRRTITKLWWIQIGDELDDVFSV